MALRLNAFAKVNLRLEVLRKREDGYHEIRTILQKISLHDTLYFSLRKGNKITIKTNLPSLPTGKDNLVYKAAELVRKRFGYDGGIEIKIQKRIPLGAGLGGGSSDAATTLKAMNQLLRLNLSRKVLMEMGMEIGADVPFFFLESSAIGSGIGARLKEVELPPLWYILIYPNFEISTRWAYQNSLLTNQHFHINLNRFFKTPEGISRILLNHLEGVVSKKYPQIEAMKGMLSMVNPLGVLMTGSGPTVFGLFADKKGASEAYQRIKEMVIKKGWSVFQAKGLS